MKTRTPHDLFFDQLQDLYSVEAQLVKALTTLIELTTHPDLRDLLLLHSSQTEAHGQLVIKIFEGTGVEIENDTCKAMKGLIKGGKIHLKGVHEPETRDLMMIAHCLRIEHYEIAAYTITARLAGRLDLAGEADILREILREEESATARLLALEPVIFELARLSR